MWRGREFAKQESPFRLSKMINKILHARGQARGGVGGALFCFCFVLFLSGMMVIS